MDDAEYEDIDQLSQSMTQSEFGRLLEDQGGEVILEDVTDRLKDAYQLELSHDGAL